MAAGSDAVGGWPRLIEWAGAHRSSDVEQAVSVALVDGLGLLGLQLYGVERLGHHVVDQ